MSELAFVLVLIGAATCVDALFRLCEKILEVEQIGQTTQAGVLGGSAG